MPAAPRRKRVMVSYWCSRPVGTLPQDLSSRNPTSLIPEVRFFNITQPPNSVVAVRTKRRCATRLIRDDGVLDRNPSAGISPFSSIESAQSYSSHLELSLKNG